MKIKVLRSCGGPGFYAEEGQVIERDAKNAERLDSLVRHGGAVIVDEEPPKKKLEESGGQSEDSDVLHDPPRPRLGGRKRFNKANDGGAL